MSNEIDYPALCSYARNFSRLTNEKIELLQSVSSTVQPHVMTITESFYAHLATIPKTKPYLEGRLENLKSTHAAWVAELFTSQYDENYTRKMFTVGDVHVKVKLPVEFMAGAVSIIQAELIRLFSQLYKDDPILADLNEAIIAATSFSLLVMQESFQSSSLAQELEKFLKITGMSRKLFNNLALAYN
jgi:hypothetical protein